MLKFKEWLLINEGKEEKILASELAGDPVVLTSLSEVIPQGKNNTDKLLLLAAYYYSKNKNIQQVKTDMTAYILYLNRNKMELINVDLVSKKPSPPWDDYLHWTEVIHGHQGEDKDKERSKFKPSDIDFQNEKPVLTSSDGKIKVYKANNPQQCIILGKGQSFCISQPGNRMWQSYRDNQTSSFYFVYDDTRNDRLSIVVVDARPSGTVLTDQVNKTGTTLDPYTGQLTQDSQPYIKYLSEKGIDVSKIVNIPKSPEEKEEQEKLGVHNHNLNWFKSLSPDYKSKYIGRGHLLTNQQFDYLWQNKFTSLLTQYVKTGLVLNDYQIDKITTNRDLKDNYLHNRLIADQNNEDLTGKEYSLLDKKQKESVFENMNHYRKLDKALSIGDLDIVKYFLDKSTEIPPNALSNAMKSANLDIVKYIIEEKGAKIGYYTVDEAVRSGNLNIVKYLMDKQFASLSMRTVADAAFMASSTGNLDILEYIIEEKGGIIDIYTVGNISAGGNLDVVKYLVEKGGKISDFAVTNASISGNLDLVKYLEDEIKAQKAKKN
jgi:hypothetical protein